jgi:long-chain fatty acid transport protein
LWLGVGSAFALGSSSSEIGTDSALALAKGNAAVADPQDPSTLMFNPAGLTRLKGTQFNGNATVVAVFDTYKGSNGGVDESAAVVPAVVPGMFASFQTPFKHVTAGVGVNSPFGLSTKYSSTGNFRYTGYFNEILTNNFTAALAYEVSPQLSIGGGMSYMSTTFKQVAKLNTAFIATGISGFPGIDDSPFELDARGQGMGWNLGALITLDERQTLGVAYRSQVSVKYGGEINVDNLGVLAGTFGGTNFKTSADFDLTFPDALTFGYHLRATDKLDLEFDTTYTRWSSFDTLHVTFDQSNAILDALGAVTQDYNDSWSYHLGASYKLNPTWTMLGGGFYYQQAANKANYSNVIPDGDRHGLTAGLLYSAATYDVTLTYSGIYKGPSKIDNSVGTSAGAVVDGEYSGVIHLLAAGVTKRY